jgi:hypothetical protein
VVLLELDYYTVKNHSYRRQKKSKAVPLQAMAALGGEEV